MKSFEALLNIENSFLAKALWLGLYGLRASLIFAQNHHTSDPGNNACSEVIQQLDMLLQEADSDEVTERARSEEQNLPLLGRKDVLPSTPLSLLRETILEDSDLSECLERSDLISLSDADLWTKIQHLFLRIPQSSAIIWKERALQLAEQAGAIAEPDNVITIPFQDSNTVPQVLYPGLQGSVQAPGLCLSPDLPLDLDIPYEPQSEDLDFLASIVSVYTKFIELEPTLLYHALESIEYFRISSLEDPEQRGQYVNELLERFRQVQATPNDTIAALESRIRLDEAIHALMYKPPVAQDSWWGEMQQSARRTLSTAVARARDEGHKVQIRPLSGRYADVRPFSSSYDLSLESYGIPGEVVVCLRVFTKINNNELPGRVIFRSLRR